MRRRWPTSSSCSALATDRYAELKDHARKGWSQGNYALLAERLEPAARELVDACAISAGQEVLDVAAGNGNLAVLAAREGAAVVASDLTPRMLELGRQRAEAEGLGIEWVEADAEALPFEAGRFDCAASVFGAMFAPDHRRVASELFRVVRPGGTVGMANWTPTGFQAGFFEIMSRYGPPLPEGVEPASHWGGEQIVRERLDRLASSVTVEPRQILWEFPSFEAMDEFFRSTSPRQAQIAQESGAAAMQAMMAGIAELVRRFNQKDDGSIRVEADYVLIVARKRG